MAQHTTGSGEAIQSLSLTVLRQDGYLLKHSPETSKSLIVQDNVNVVCHWLYARHASETPAKVAPRDVLVSDTPATAPPT